MGTLCPHAPDPVCPYRSKLFIAAWHRGRTTKLAREPRQVPADLHGCLVQAWLWAYDETPHAPEAVTANQVSRNTTPRRP